MSQQGMRTFSTEFKEAVVLRLEAGERIAAVSDELKIRRKLLYEWRAAYRKLGVAGLNRKRGRKPGGGARARSASNRWTSIFFAKPCGSSTRGTCRLARRHLRGH
jgi:transposase-like protein